MASPCRSKSSVREAAVLRTNTDFRQPASNPIVSFPVDKGSAGDQGSPVYLHIYDLGPIAKILNGCVSRDRGLGAFHCGLEVLGIEWSFQAVQDCFSDEKDETSGVSARDPKSHRRHVYKESVYLGQTSLKDAEVGTLLSTFGRLWPARHYHFMRKNCTDFAEALAQELKVPLPFPVWVHGIAKSSAASETLGNLGDKINDGMMRRPLTDTTNISWNSMLSCGSCK